MRFVIAFVLLLAIQAVNAQPIAPVRPAFDAASIRANPTGGGKMKFLASPGGRLAVENMPLRLLIMNAWGVRDFQIFGGPDWTSSDRFDIAAKAEGDPGEKQILGPMLQALLEERFQLKVRREIRELPVFTLSVAKNGIHLKESKPGDCGQPELPCREIIAGMNPEGTRLRGEQASIEQLVFTLSSVLGRTVVDKTGFGGRFDIDLAVNIDDVSAVVRAVSGIQPIENPTASSIFSALEREAGLRLVNGKGPVEVLVIDHVERPAAN